MEKNPNGGDPSITELIRGIATGQRAPTRQSNPEAGLEQNDIYSHYSELPENDELGEGSAIVTTSRLGKIKEKFTKRNVVAGTVAAGLLLFAGNQVFGGSDDSDSAFAPEGTVLFVSPTLPETTTTTTLSVEDAETPTFNTFDIEDESAETTSTTAATSTTTSTSTTTTTTTTTTTSTIPDTTTTTPPETAPPTTPPAPTTRPPTTLPTNPYALLDCSAESTVMQRGWSFSEVGNNCGLRQETLERYNPCISDYDQIMTGTTIYLKPDIASCSSGETNASTSSQNGFDCGAQLGRYYTVGEGQTPSSFLTNIVVNDGFTAAQAEWMLGFQLISRYNLDEQPFLAGTKRCGPTENAYAILFSSGVPER